MSKKKRTIRQNLIARELHKHPFFIPLVTLSVLLVITLIGSVIFGSTTVGPSDAHVVQLSVDGKKQTIPTRAATVDEFLSRAEVNLKEGDVVEPAKDTEIADDNFRINIYRARPVTIFDGEKRIQALSAATTARSVAVQVGVEVFPEDRLKQEVSSNILRDQVIGEKIVIERATPAHLNLYGTSLQLRTHAKTVGELLKEKNVTLASGDSVQPTVDQRLAANTQVFVTRFGTQITTIEEAIPMEVQTVEDASLSFGSTAIRQKGSDGKKIVTYQLDLQNGKEVGRRIIQEARVLEPVKQIVARGKAVSIPEDKSVLLSAAGISQGDYPYVNFIMSRESGWCPTKLQGHRGACPGYPPSFIPANLGYGLGQATPGTKMASAGADWQSNPVTQLRWCNGYAIARYGSWAKAYEFWLANKHW